MIISDFQRTNWAGADFAALPDDVHIQLESLAPAEPPENLAVLSVAVDGHPVEGQPGRLEVEIGNYSPTARRVACEVALGELAYRLEGVAPASGKITLSQDVALAETGWQIGNARLVETSDALAADDSRDFSLMVHPPAPIALVTRQRPTTCGRRAFSWSGRLPPICPANMAKRSAWPASIPRRSTPTRWPRPNW